LKRNGFRAFTFLIKIQFLMACLYVVYSSSLFKIPLDNSSKREMIVTAHR
jgi:hypothetical protein